MRNLIIALGLILSITFTSCQKQEVRPQIEIVEEAGTIDETISVFGDWLLVGGTMYMENLETGEKTSYSHFDANKTVSSLRYSGWMYDIERLVVDSTTWSFVAPPNIPNTGEFYLNGNTTQPYGFHLTTSNMSIVENSTGPQQMGGSARPISAYLNGVPNQANFYVQEAYESINGVNYKYFSELTFEKI